MRAWKHHISQHFIDDPSLLSKNGPAAGATIFLDYQFMKEFLLRDGRDWHICEFEVEEEELSRDFGGKPMATILINKDSIGPFRPL